MTDNVEPRLDVVADLRLDIDGVRAQVSADGDRIDITTASPRRLLAALAATPLPTLPGHPAPGRTRSAGAAADRLADAGLTVTVRGPSGPVVRVGHEVDSRLIGRLTGSPHMSVVIGGRTRRIVVSLIAATAAAIAGGVIVRRVGR